jgi:gliding motility-associated-like protein
VRRICRIKLLVLLPPNMKLKLILILLWTPFFQMRSNAQIITTVAGNGTFGYSGDGGSATSAQLGDLFNTGVAVDNAGNKYIVMGGNASVIRKVDPAGIITTIAGTGTFGYTGDGGPATLAKLYHPSGIVIDNSGDIIFADQNDAVLRMINPAGIITTICAAYTGVCTGDGGPLANATFNSISGLSRDNAGNIYVADGICRVIRKINTSGIITTVAGNGTIGGGGDGGPAIAAQLTQPFQVGVDNSGNIYIPDGNLLTVRKVNTAGIITTIAGTGVAGYSGDGGPALLATFDGPKSICIDNADNIYIADHYNNVVRKIDNAGIITTYAGTGFGGYSGDGGPANAAMTTEISNVSIDNVSNLYLVDYHNYVIRKVNNCITSSISAQPSNVTLCGSGNASFSVTASNVITYQWQVNTGTGWNNVIDGSVYGGATTAVLTITGASITMHNNQYRCLLTNGCGVIYSITVTLSVQAPVTPSITIATSSTTICQGTNVTFTSAILNGGGAPIYQWKKNGSPVGANSSSYSNNSLSNGDVITCSLTSNATCVSSNNANSNPISMTVTPTVTPAITISASANNICFGTPVTFTSAVTNGGATPNFTWFKNSVNLFVNSPTYTDNALNNGDVIMGVLASNLTCITSGAVPSLPITMSVTYPVTPSVTITASPTAVCKNSPVILTAAAINPGTLPIFQWKKNGLSVGTNNPIYTENNPVNGDIITCTLISSQNCITSSQVNGNPITLVVYPDPIVSLDQNNSLCGGANKTLDAGSFASYIWSTGSVNQTIIVNGPGTYSVTVTDNNGCSGIGSTSITNILPAPTGFLPADTAVCSYGFIQLKAQTGFLNYLWNTGSSGTSITVSQPGQYWLQVVDGNNCTGKDYITVNPKQCLKGLFVPSGFTPNNDGKNDVLKPILGGKVKVYKFQIFNRWGQLVFETSDPSKGWDGRFGGMPQDEFVFAWTCKYQFEGEPAAFQKGIVTLIR